MFDNSRRRNHSLKAGFPPTDDANMRSVATVRIWAESEYHARDQFYSRGLVSDTDPTLLDIPSRDGKLSFEFVVTGRRRAD